MKTRLLALISACAFSATLAFAAADKPAACCSATDKAACEKPAACDKSAAAPKCAKDKAACACAKCAKDDKAACAKCESCKKDASCKKDTSCKKDAAEKTCPVSGEKLGSMGAPYKYTYKAAGQPDREVLFCCKMCVKGFEKNPAKYLAQSCAK